MQKEQLTVTVPQGKLDRNYKERLKKLARKRERSISYLLLDAIDRYLKTEEKR